MTITEADYPKLTELLTLTHTVTLDCERGGYSQEELDDDGGPYIYLNFGGNEDFYGNATSDYLEGLGDKALAKRFRTFVQPDGEIGLEISFLPGEPLDIGEEEDHVRALWDATRLHELMSYEDYIQDLEDGAPWTAECFGNGGEMYALLVEVTKPGRKASLEKNFDSPLLEKPLWIQRKGEKHNVHIHYWQD